MKLLYFRGGHRDGQILEFRNTEPPAFLLTECGAMYTVKPSGSPTCYFADFEELPLPESV